MAWTEADQLLPIAEASILEQAPHVRCSVGVMAFREEANIARCLDSLLAQQTDVVQIEEIVVVVSGSTDDTAAIVQEYRNHASTEEE